MKSLWQNGKVTSLGKRVAALALVLCFLASFVQNISFKPISATETVSGSDITVVTESDATTEESTVDSASETDADKSEGSNAPEKVESDVSDTDIPVSEISETDVSDSDAKAEVSYTDAIEPVSQMIEGGTAAGADESPVAMLFTSAAPAADYGEPQITMTTTQEIGSEIIFYANTASDGEVFVDWGDGSPIGYNTGYIIGTTSDNELKIYSNDAITVFDCGAEGRNMDMSAEYGYKCCMPSLLNVTNCPSLVELDCNANSLTSLNMTNNGNLERLNCDGAQFATIDLSNNAKLKDLNISYSKVTSLDLTNNINLEKLWVMESELSSLNLTNCKKLVELFCGENQLTELDISTNTSLTNIDCATNQLTSLDVTNNTELVFLCCGFNSIVELDVSKNTKLEELVVLNMSLTELDISNCADLLYIACNDNKLKFSTMTSNIPALVEENPYGAFDNAYAPQAKVEIPSQANEIDLSSEYDINGTKTVYTWYNAADDSVVTPNTSANGVFTFGEDFLGESLYCVMTNDIFPDLTLKTTNVEITEDIPELGEPQLIVTTTGSVGKEIEILIARHTDENGNEVYTTEHSDVYVDWGDGNPVRYTRKEEIKGDTIKLWWTKDVDELAIRDYASEGSKVNIGTVELTGPAAYLYCYGAVINKLDTSDCNTLLNIECEESKINSIDASGCKELVALRAWSSGLTSLDLEGCTNIYEICADNGNLAAVDFSGLTKLSEVILDGNQLAELDLSDCGNLTYLSFVDNKVDSVEIKNWDSVVVLSCENNKLTFSDIKVTPDEIALRGDPEGMYAAGMTYAPQAKVEIPSQAYEIDLSSEYDINGTKTVYTWYNAADDSVVTPNTSANGVFTFGEEFVGESLYCTMTNDVFPDLTLTTTNVEITEAPKEEEPEVSDGDFTVEDDNDYVGDVEVEEGTTFEDENGNEVLIGNLHLIIGNVENDKQKHVVEAVKRYNEAFDTEGDNYALYEIHLETDNGVKVTEIDGRIQICIKYPKNLGAECTDYTYNLYHLKDDGTVEEVKITCKPNGIWFYADDFSPFVLTWSLKTQIDSEVQGDSDSSNPKTGDDSNNVTAAIVLASSFVLMAACAVSGVIIYKKRRKAEK